LTSCYTNGDSNVNWLTLESPSCYTNGDSNVNQLTDKLKTMKKLYVDMMKNKW